ncbi:MAG TPA: SUMF1/EgtB/PvdO family nonheme iron enzyme [Bryobacteraceae bacterium]|nr:SUMF1/EgtB/PvdO family nonheme iron enzyme [Bryobacteraceae bacterium]
MRFALLCALAVGLWAQDSRYSPQNEEIPGPPSPADFPAWLADIQHWRFERRIRMGYDDAQYRRPELLWAQSSFVQPQMMVEDRYFYDPVAGKYTVDRYLDDLEKRYGGIDSVLIWHTYPNIGIDNRNQNDLLRDMPGGIAGLRQMIADFHRRGVRVLFPIMLWDQGTREEGVPNWTATAKLFAEIGADGLNGDTLRGVPRVFREASDQTGHPLVLEPESGLDADEMLAWNNMTWGYWKYAPVPTVSRYKWLETRHMVNICRRWARDKTDDLQHAFFNGIGYESWENIWGIWNQINPRDAEALRRIAKIERRFSALLVSPQWEPHTPTLQVGVYASKFPTAGETIWTFVNRNEYGVSGRQIRIRRRPGMRYFDLWNGIELRPEETGEEVTLGFAMEPWGYGAVLEARSAPGGFLAEMRELAKVKLQSLSHERPVLPQRLVETAVTAKAAAAPPGMVRIPGGEFRFEVHGIEIEGFNEIGVDVQYPWEDSPRRHHLRLMRLAPFYLDRYPVTNEQFRKFLEATHYRPQDGHNFLKDWTNGAYPESWGTKPVTWVSIEDARAYAHWAGKRLPHEWEWQYAAQGSDGRRYPWGNQWDPAAVPRPETGHSLRGPDNVAAHPRGASPFGVEDLVGNVWQWTDEYVDEHTRAGILRGGSYYQPQGSHWYFPQAYRLDEHGKYLLIAPSKDRAGTVGFRCAADAP